jgi:hypothetical protein
MGDLKDLINSEIGEYSVSDDVDPTELAIGIQTEMEHTNDLKIAKEIALDHLSHHPNYYSELAKAGLSRDFQSKPSSGYGDPDSGFNDTSRVGDNLMTNTNMGGSIGNTPDGKVCGRRSNPVHNKMLDIELQESSKKKPVPTNPKLWSKAKSIAKSKFDTWPSAYASGWAAKWYKGKGGKWKMKSSSSPKEAFDPTISTITNDSGTYNSGYDYVGPAENTHNNMKIKQSQLKNEIKEMVRNILEDAEIEDSQEDINTEEETESVTLTLDKNIAQALCDILSDALDEEDDGEDDEYDADESEIEVSDVEDSEIESSDVEPPVVSEAKNILKKRR